MSREDSNSVPSLDRGRLQKLRSDFGEDPAFVPEVLETYLSDSRNVVLQLRDAVEATDADTFRRAAHALRGSSSNVGARRMVELCRMLEEIAVSEEPCGALNLLAEIEQEFEQVEREIRSELRPGTS